MTDIIEIGGDRYVNTSGAARILGVTASALRRARNEGREAMHWTKVGQEALYPLVEVEARARLRGSPS
jgi:hypothetical protein